MCTYHGVVSTEEAHNTHDLYRRVTDLEHSVVTLDQRLTVLETGDTPTDGRVSTTKAAQMLGLAHRSSVKRLIDRGDLDAYRHPASGRWRVTVQSINQYLTTT